jgi:hypothetical protein
MLPHTNAHKLHVTHTHKNSKKLTTKQTNRKISHHQRQYTPTQKPTKNTIHQQKKKHKNFYNKTNQHKNKERIPPKGDINWCPLHPATTAAALTKTATPILSCLFTRAHKNEVKGRSGDKGTDICVEGSSVVQFKRRSSAARRR